MIFSSQRRIPIVVALFVMITVALSATVLPHAQAAQCFATGCAGKNPATMGCAADARTLAPYGGANGQTGGDIMNKTMHIELRYSNACNAAWVRVSVASPWYLCNERAWVSSSAGYTQSVYPTCVSPGSWYSNMVPDTTGQVAWACGAFLHEGGVCTGKY